MNYPIEFFSNELSTKLENFHKFFRDQEKKINSQLSGAFIEAFIRNFIHEHIGIKRIAHGTIYTQTSNTLSKFLEFDETPNEDYHLQIDGILYDPTKCAPAISISDFVIINALHCEGVVEVKMSCTDDEAFFKRLYSIHSKCGSKLQRHKVFGVVIKTKANEDTLLSLQKKYHDFSIHYLYKEDLTGFLSQRATDVNRFFESVFKLNT
jgi:hypothetical protein